MPSQHSRLYRRLVREVAKASIAPRSQRNKEISTNFRTLFERNHQSKTFQHDVENVLTFMHSQRQYKMLLERYNPLIDLTAEERIEATARRLYKPPSRYLAEDLQTVVFPTETVYGLGALALDASASARIFATKGRPPDNPLIVHVSSQRMLLSLLPAGYILPSAYRVLIDRFWPGPLTLLFPRDPVKIPNIITAGQPTVAIRMPSHPVARALIAVSNSPLAAPSANSSGKPSPTRAEHVLGDLGGNTVVDGLHEDGNIRVLRPGGVPVEDIERVLIESFNQGTVPKVLVHRRDFLDEDIERAPTTPGMKYRHYSPSVPVKLLWTISKPPHGEEAITPLDLLNSLKLASAQRLFDGFLTLEKAGVDIILVEEVSEDREGLAIMNRVKKAAGEACWIMMAV
ncbi:YwlC protein [Pisolithus croceorrhizus]|nr:YwlC protein [Pisolithus croceorrhizus]